MTSRRPARGGARKGAGRPPAADKADHVVYVRLTSEERVEAEKRALRAGYETISAHVKAWLTGKL